MKVEETDTGEDGSSNDCKSVARVFAKAFEYIYLCGLDLGH